MESGSSHGFLMLGEHGGSNADSIPTCL
jgi:hypothetical protein